MTTYIVITTIQQPTPSVQKLVMSIGNGNKEFKCIIIGDKKGPISYDLEGTDFFDIERQSALPFVLSSVLPAGHYARKNLGYLIAVHDGATCIYETDDDNAPLDCWQFREKQTTVKEVSQSGWINIFRLFSDKVIWPRGFPLAEVRDSLQKEISVTGQGRSENAPVQQGLANGSPDVDAVWRLTMDNEISFHGNDSFLLPQGSWCPFNSQSTWWWPEAYPFLYLPSTCSFRMTDIWRGFIAQRCLWAMGYGIVFHPPEVYQERNEHDLMKDFQDEVPGYTRNQELVKILTDLELNDAKDSVGENLLLCYEKLTDEGFFMNAELAMVNAWLRDLKII